LPFRTAADTIRKGRKEGVGYFPEKQT